MNVSSSADRLRSGAWPRPRLAPLRRAWPLALALAVIALVLSGAACTTQGRVAFVSAVFLPDVLVDMPVRPVTWLTADPIVERRFIEYDGGSILVDIYRPPSDGAHPAMIFSMGAPPMDLDHPRLVRLGEDAARAGLVLVAPFSERLDREIIDEEELDALTGVYEYMERQPYVDPERVGFIGVSAGAPLALLAAGDERIADDVRVVISFGGYYDAVETLAAVGARRLTYDGLVEPWEPHEHTLTVLARQLMRELPARADRRVLRAAFVNERPVTEGEVAAMTPAGRAAYELLSGTDPKRVPELIDALPPAAIEQLRALSPRGRLDPVQADLFVIHDRGDDLIPYTESRRLRDELGDREGVYYSEVTLFEHVHPRLSQGGDVIVIDGAKLYFRLYQLLMTLS